MKLAIALAASAFAVLANTSADAQYRYGPANPTFRYGPVNRGFSYGNAPMIRQPVPYGNVAQGFRTLPPPVYRTYGQFVAQPSLYSAGRAVGYTVLYPRTAY